MLAAFDQGMVRDEPSENAGVHLVSPRYEVEIVPEKQRRGGPVPPEDVGRVHERDAVTRRKRLQLLEGPVVQVHRVLANAVLITNRRQRRRLCRDLPWLRVGRE